MMHVCHVLYEPETGGQATHVAALVEALRAQDYQATVISGLTRAEWLATIRALGAEADALPLTKRGSVSQVIRLARHLRVLRADIVHLHGQFAGVWGRVAARLAGVSHVVYTPHAVQIRSRRLRPFYHLAECWLRRWCDAVVYVCQHDADVAVRRGWATARQAVVIPNGVDVAALQRQAAGAGRLAAEKHGARWILQAGRLHEQKGLDVLLAAVRDVIVLCPDVMVLLAGDGPLRDELHVMARRWGIEHRVRFLGWRDDVPALMAAADVVALASRWEAMPYALLEAMALGRPCVATRVGGVPEVMQDGLHGYMVPAGDPAVLAKALLLLLNNPAQAAEFGRAAAAQVANRYSLAQMQSETIRLYRRLAGEAWN